jgi:hypothetical protein
MIQNVLQEVGGVGMYGVISVCLFFAVFGGMLLWACRMKKSLADRLGAMPLAEEASAPAQPKPSASEVSL